MLRQITIHHGRTGSPATTKVIPGNMKQEDFNHIGFRSSMGMAIGHLAQMDSCDDETLFQAIDSAASLRLILAVSAPYGHMSSKHGLIASLAPRTPRDGFGGANFPIAKS